MKGRDGDWYGEKYAKVWRKTSQVCEIRAARVASAVFSFSRAYKAALLMPALGLKYSGLDGAQGIGCQG